MAITGPLRLTLAILTAPVFNAISIAVAPCLAPTVHATRRVAHRPADAWVQTTARTTPTLITIMPTALPVSTAIGIIMLALMHTPSLTMIVLITDTHLMSHVVTTPMLPLLSARTAHPATIISARAKISVSRSSRCGIGVAPNLSSIYCIYEEICHQRQPISAINIYS